jgi:hypothetical protein
MQVQIPNHLQRQYAGLHSLSHNTIQEYDSPTAHDLSASSAFPSSAMRLCAPTTQKIYEHIGTIRRKPIGSLLNICSYP